MPGNFRREELPGVHGGRIVMIGETAGRADDCPCFSWLQGPLAPD